MQSKKKILIIGGTQFVGRQLVEKLSKEDTYDIYLFNRGKTNADLFPEIKRIIGDRETDDIEQINKHKWEYIIDFSSYFPKSLERTLQNINKDVTKYIYISTISVYAFEEYDGTSKIKEDFPKKKYEGDQLIEPSLKFYGEKKSACEDILNNAKELNSIILRPSVIYGKYDPTDRLYYWIERIKKKEKILLPDNGKHLISLTYASDLVQIILNCIAGQVSNGTYNCVSDDPIKFRAIVETIKEKLQSECTFTPIEAEKLKKEKLTANDFPFWWGANIMIDNSKIKDALDMKGVSLEDAIKSTIDYYENQGWQKPIVGIESTKEDKLMDTIATPNMTEFTFELRPTDEYIELIKLLKLKQIAQSGAHAKMLVEDGLVKVNGAQEFRKRNKLRSGDVIEIEDNRIKII